MQKIFMLAAAFSGFMSVALGAFGAHGLKDKLTPKMLSVFQTAVQYQFYHTLAMLLVSILMFHVTSKYLNLSVISFLLGIILFSGSLYALSITGIAGFGIITPLGGMAFLLGWFMLFVGIAKSNMRFK